MKKIQKNNKKTYTLIDVYNAMWPYSAMVSFIIRTKKLKPTNKK